MDFHRFFLKKFFSIKGKRDFFSFSSLVSIAGITIGVIALTVSLALFSGYYDTMKDIILGVNSHIYILKFGSDTIDEEGYQGVASMLDTLEAIQAYAPFLYTEGMALREADIAGVIVRGIDFEKEIETSDLGRFIDEGTYKREGDFTVIGKNIAKRLHATVGDTIKLITPMNADITFAGMIPSSIEVEVAGIFSSGMFEFDNSLVLLPMNTAQEFLSVSDQYSGISVKLHKEYIEEADVIASHIQHKLSYPYNVSNWISLNKNLFSLLKLEKWVIFIIIALIVLVAGFGLTSVLSMHILDKRKEIGILKALGTTNRDLKKIFFSRNMIIGFTGIALGLIVGLLISLLLTHTDIIKIESDVYLIEHLVVVNQPIDFVCIILVAGIIIVMSSYFPLRKISQLQAVSIIRISKK